MTNMATLGPLAGAAWGLVERVRRSVVVVAARDGQGSGVIWDMDGLVITNHHVAPRERAMVELADGERREATVIGRDPDQDLALLRLEEGRLPTTIEAATVGDSERLIVGELPLAVGHPRGVRGTATLGIVSGVGGAVSWGRHRRELLQADIALAPGNSGGPLVNMDGEVVGIASMVMSPGIALAVPSRTVTEFVRIVLDHAGTRRPVERRAA